MHKLKLPLLKKYQKNGVYIAAIQGNNAFPQSGRAMPLSSCIDGSTLGEITWALPSQLDSVIAAASEQFKHWRMVPAPQRGELVRRIGEVFRQHKAQLAEVITYEAGKTVQEAQGEVQECIDICDFAVGLSRQLYGLTIASERPSHRMMEQWHPLGPIGVITAFNFPMAVWAWNAMIALVCGDPVIWKPSEKTPLCALACHGAVQEALSTLPDYPQGLSAVVIGDAEIGQKLCADRRLPLISATGSVTMGKKVGQAVAARLGRSILELGGNNALIVTESADIEMALRGIVFSAVGTTGQRCTTLRRLFVHHSIADKLLKPMIKAYQSLAIGDPRDEGNLMGPLIDEAAFNAMQNALEQAKKQGGECLTGGARITKNVSQDAYYVQPAIVKIKADAPILQQETFAPILYIIEYKELPQALEWHNNVPQGLSSAIFTADTREAEVFLSPQGSDCGIANVNIGTSGAEIGGAFGGEKETGGGRESGSDAWKSYMRRATNTINYGKELPLAQGVEFKL